MLSLAYALAYTRVLSYAQTLSLFSYSFSAFFIRSPSWVLDRIAAIEPRKSTSLASADHSPSTLLQDKSNESNTVKEGEEQQEQKEEEEVKQEEQEINEEPILQGDGLEQQQKQQQQSEELGSRS